MKPIKVLFYSPGGKTTFVGCFVYPGFSSYCYYYAVALQILLVRPSDVLYGHLTRKRKGAEKPKLISTFPRQE